MSLRKATSGDVDMLWSMLFEAAYWDVAEEQRPAAQEFRSTTALAPCVHGFGGQSGDRGVVAETDARVPIGAAWYRFFTEDEPMWGFVHPEVPELSIGVASGFRGTGVGGAMLHRLIETAEGSGVAALSLSVALGNSRARRLYQGFGFMEIGGPWEGSVTMVRNSIIEP